MKSISLIILLSLITFCSIEAQTPDKIKSKDWKPLLDQNLSQWEIWTGVPDPSVPFFPEGYQLSADGKPTEAVGLGDPYGVYSVTNEDGELVLNIKGIIYAGLTSKKEYANYHLTTLVKFGDKKYAPRLDKKRDNGILYHCYGEHGAFWNVWKRCLEMQVQETDMGDLFTLAGTKAKTAIDSTNHWSASSTTYSDKGVKRSKDYENPHGEWTRLDLYVFENKAIHMVNGNIVLALKDAVDHEGNPLTKGQIQIQSEGADCYYKDLLIRPIQSFPKKVLLEAGL